ncbi:MAG TPA: sigma-70 family RNA polymerase sigma factor [Bryobacteraceae bacterium]|nr:sigma-70 family RNA polymerase sigma factor [Bryobacteraceae bacterium]
MQPRASTAGHTGEGIRLNADPDLTDVEKVLAGDVAAFENIVRRWQGPLVNLAYRFCRDRSRAEDMAQEAFLRAYRGLHSWRKDAAFSTWLFAVATNLYRSEIRRIPPPMTSLDDIVEPGDARALSHASSEEGRDHAVRRAVLALPEKYREALTLFYFHEKDISQSARSLGVAEGTLKARLNRGREILRGKLPRLLRDLNLKETS